MGVTLLYGKLDGYRNAAVMVCSTSGLAFGPLFKDTHEAEAFLSHCRSEGVDARQLDDVAKSVHEWRQAQAEEENEKDLTPKLKASLRVVRGGVP